MLEKFGSASEFVAFLESDSGRKFLEPSPARPTIQAARIFGSIQKGAIFTLIGVVGFGVVASDLDDLNALAIPSGIALAIGLGLSDLRVRHLQAVEAMGTPAPFGLLSDARRRRSATMPRIRCEARGSDCRDVHRGSPPTFAGSPARPEWSEDLLQDTYVRFLNAEPPRHGRTADAVVSLPDRHQPGLRRLEGDAREREWEEVAPALETRCRSPWA